MKKLMVLMTLILNANAQAFSPQAFECTEESTSKELYVDVQYYRASVDSGPVEIEFDGTDYSGSWKLRKITGKTRLAGYLSFSANGVSADGTDARISLSFSPDALHHQSAFGHAMIGDETLILTCKVY